MSSHIEVKNLTKIYKNKEREFKAVDNVTLSINKNDIYGIMGLSGAGKSTFIRMLNRLEEPTSGEIFVNGENIINFSKKKLMEYRRKTGMIFQHFNLLSSRDVKGNVAFALELAKWPKNKINPRVDELLELVGLEDKKDVFPSQLSGGQKQRVAIARALANYPEILLSDEATSALDPRTTASILELLKDIQSKLGLTIVLITHQMEVIRKVCNRTAIMSEGKVIEEAPTKEIFLNPKNDLTKEFVSHITPERERKNEKLKTGGKQIVKLTFPGDQADKPYISELVKKFGLDLNILGGSIDDLTDASIGHLLVEFLGNVEDRNNAIIWLKDNKIEVEEI